MTMYYTMQILTKKKKTKEDVLASKKDLIKIDKY